MRIQFQRLPQSYSDTFGYSYTPGLDYYMIALDRNKFKVAPETRKHLRNKFPWSVLTTLSVDSTMLPDNDGILGFLIHLTNNKRLKTLELRNYNTKKGLLFQFKDLEALEFQQNLSIVFDNTIEQAKLFYRHTSILKEIFNRLKECLVAEVEEVG